MPKAPAADEATLRRLAATLPTKAAVADTLGISRQGASHLLKKHGITMPRRGGSPPVADLAPSQLLPWTIREEHRKNPIIYAMWCWVKREQGRPMNHGEQRRCEAFLRYLAGENQYGRRLVVDYRRDPDPDADGAVGFFYRPWDPKLDAPDAVLRQPGVAEAKSPRSAGAGRQRRRPAPGTRKAS